MKNKITFTYGGKDYVLEFTRKSVEEMERRGFVAEDFLSKPMTMLPTMFAGAFIAHHRLTKRKLIDEIFATIDNKTELINTLAEMYSLVINEYIDELEKVDNGLPWKCE